MKKQSGFTLIEVMVAALIFSIIAIAIASVVQTSVVSLQRSKQRTMGARFAQVAFAELENIPYYYIFKCDSSSTNFALNGTFGAVDAQKNTYPYLATLNNLLSIAKQHGFDRYTVDVIFYLRDVSDINGNGQTGDIRPFMDNGSKMDTYDHSIKYNDQNSDHDFYDFYGNPYVTEEPDTHLKKVVLKVYRNNKFIYEQSRLISMEKYSGAEYSDSSAMYKLEITSPAKNNPSPENVDDTIRSSVYALATAQQQTSFNLPHTLSFPDWIKTVRSDTSQNINISGQTDPLAVVSFRIGFSTNPVLDTVNADVGGYFNFTSYNVTNTLVEGYNKLIAIASKDGEYSPYTIRDFIYDKNPPSINLVSPLNGSTVKTRQPLVGAKFIDTPLTAGAQISGVCSRAIYLTAKAGASASASQVTEHFDFRASSEAFVSWLDTTTFLPVVLSTGVTYTMAIEVADYAQYKASTTWSFTCQFATFDVTGPVVDNVVTTLGNPPAISCNIHDEESGININSVRMTVDGEELLNSGNLAGHYSILPYPYVGIAISYTPPGAYVPGSHSVFVYVNHWVNNPSNVTTSTATWNFNE